jgi:nucleoside-diphosphate-sugar epimerase
MNVLVTGATGFIGRSLCRKLLSSSHIVRGSVRMEEPLTNLPEGVQAAPVEAIGPETDWSEALRGIDTVVHLAARVHVIDDTAVEPFAVYRRVNVAGTEKLARMAAAGGVQRLVFLSSVKVNGEETAVPYLEQDRPAPQDPYGISKMEAEEVLRKIAAATGLEVVIIRSPLVYGPGVKANFLHLLSIVERGIPLPLGSINNSRSLIYLGNLIDAIITCATHPQAAGQTFLVSDGEDVSIPELVLRVGDALHRPVRLFAFPLFLMRLVGSLTGNAAAVDRLIGSLVVDSGKIRRELLWRPPYTMTEGLRETAAWYTNHSGS